MRKKALMIAIVSMLTVAALVGAARVVFGAGSTDIPVAYVISDGTDCYFINYDDLLDSYMVYEDDPEADNARLAKFYFDTLGNNVMDRFKAYVSGITSKFVSFNDIIDKYMEDEDVDATYIWFNSFDAAPAFSVITRVWVLDASCSISGRYYVGTDGYIIRRSAYYIDTTAPAQASAGVPQEFAVTVTSNDLGCESFNGILTYEITGGSYTLEYDGGSGWETMTGGQIGSAATVTPDWNASADMRFTAHGAGTYELTFRLETGEGDVVAEKTLSIAVLGGMQISASVPVFRAGETAQFTLTTTALDDAGRMVQAHFTIPAAATIEYWDDAAGGWAALPDVYGPSEGFAVADETMVLRGKFNTAGAETITVQYIEIGTGTVLADKDIGVIVEQPMAVSLALPEFYTGEPGVFTVTTTANDDTGKTVQAKFTVPADAALEYQEEGTGAWIPLVGEYGGAEGFTAADSVYTFRVAFAGHGMKPITVQFVEAGTDIVLAQETAIAMVQSRVTPTIAIPGFGRITIPANTADAHVDLANPDSNTCSLIISLELTDGTVLFTSGMLLPGEKVGDITLFEALSPGEYGAIIRYDAYDAADSSPLNTAKVSIILVAE
jgi:hypothetical protein